jgi:hypothetical protein
MQFVDQFFDRMKQSLGAERARLCIDETFSAMGTRQLRTADEVVVFANMLTQRGGIFEVIGGALRVQAILRGGKEKPAVSARPR